MLLFYFCDTQIDHGSWNSPSGNENFAPIFRRGKPRPAKNELFYSDILENLMFFHKMRTKKSLGGDYRKYTTFLKIIAQYLRDDTDVYHS